MTAERDLLIAALVDPRNLVSWSAPDLDLVLRLLRRARLLGRVAAELDAAGLLGALPLAARDALASALIAAQARSRVARWELDCIAYALRDRNDLQVVAMKGCAYLLADLPHAKGRMFADVDLLVPEAHLQEVEARLREHGWRSSELSAYDERYYREWTHELPPLVHAEREVEVDLHHNVLMRTARLHPDPRLLLAAARPVPGFRYFGYLTMAPIDMTLHAMAHLFYGGEMDDALREVADIDALLRHFGRAEPGYWQEFWPRALALDLARPAYYGLRYAQRLLATPIPAPVLAASQAGAPTPLMTAAMDRLVPHALFPVHPDRPARRARFARALLYVRSHWVKMPPAMLIRHLAYKFYVRHSRTQEH